MASWCSTCFTSSGDEDSVTFVSLPCKCVSCSDCLTVWIATKAVELHFQVTEKIPCMTSTCKKLFTPHEILSQLEKDQQENINNILFDVYLRKTQDIRKCPNATCNYAGAIETNVKCKKPLECLNCGTSWRERIHYTKREKIRDLVQNCDEKSNEFLSEIWEETFTRRCPKCDVMIQKSGGCNFMTCKRCQHEFCWLCTQGPTRHNRKFCNVVSVVKFSIPAIAIFNLLFLIGIMQLITSIVSFVVGFTIGAIMFNLFLIMIYVLYTIITKTKRDAVCDLERRQAELAVFIVLTLMMVMVGLVEATAMEKHVIRAIVVEGVLATIFSEYLSTLKYTLKYYLLYSHKIYELIAWKKKLITNSLRNCFGRSNKKNSFAKEAQLITRLELK